jgi:hypothetical protein
MSTRTSKNSQRMPQAASVSFKQRPELANTTAGVRIAEAELAKCLGTFRPLRRRA